MNRHLTICKIITFKTILKALYIFFLLKFTVNTLSPFPNFLRWTYSKWHNFDPSAYASDSSRHAQKSSGSRLLNEIASDNVASMRELLDGSLWWNWIVAHAGNKNDTCIENDRLLSYLFCPCRVQKIHSFVISEKGLKANWWLIRSQFLSVCGPWERACQA